MAKQRYMRLADYARHRQVSRAYITGLKNKGVLIMRGALVNAPASDRVLDEPSTEADLNENPTTLTAARFLETLYKARLRRLEFEREQGHLLPRDEVVEQFGALIVAAKNRLRALGNSLGPAVAAETDPAVCKSLIDAEVDEALTDLSRWQPE